MEALGINVQGLVAQIINFAILIILLRMVAYKPFVQLLDDRAARVKEGLDRAEEIKREAAQSESEFAERRAEALRQAQDIVNRANQAAERIYQDAETRARGASDEFLAKSRAEIDRERQRAVAEIRSQMADLAIFAASRVVRSSLSSPDHYRLVEEALSEAEKTGQN